jgi:hypothetical protein
VRPHPLTERDQQPVAVVVAEGVVHFLEPVEVNECDHRGLSGARRAS